MQHFKQRNLNHRYPTYMKLCLPNDEAYTYIQLEGHTHIHIQVVGIISEKPSGLKELSLSLIVEFFIGLIYITNLKYAIS